MDSKELQDADQWLQARYQIQDELEKSLAKIYAEEQRITNLSEMADEDFFVEMPGNSYADLSRGK